MMIEMADRPRPAAEAAFRELSEGAVVLHLGTGAYHSVNPTGALTWSLLDGSRDVRAVAAALREHIQSPPDGLEADVAAFIAELAARGLVNV
jgi:coenzyme PQQ synthesis protein D (PqqD)